MARRVICVCYTSYDNEGQSSPVFHEADRGGGDQSRERFMFPSCCFLPRLLSLGGARFYISPVSSPDIRKSSKILLGCPRTNRRETPRFLKQKKRKMKASPPPRTRSALWFPKSVATV